MSISTLPSDMVGASFRARRWDRGRPVRDLSVIVSPGWIPLFVSRGLGDGLPTVRHGGCGYVGALRRTRECGRRGWRARHGRTPTILRRFGRPDRVTNGVVVANSL